MAHITLASFWNEGPVYNMQALCLASWVANGFEVDLYTNGPVSNVPPKVNIKDASEVLSTDYIDRLHPLKCNRPGQPVLNYSDLFRIKLMEKSLGMWLDTDIILFRNFEFDLSTPYYAWEDRTRIGSPVFYLPPDSPFIPDYNRVYDAPDLMPHWLGFKRRVVKPLVWRLTGQKFNPRDLGVTVYGNDAFSRLIKKHDMTRYALSPKPFYCWNAGETLRFYEDTPEWRIEDDPEVIGLHVHRKEYHDRSQLQYVNKRPGKDSLYARMLERYADHLPDLAWD